MIVVSLANVSVRPSSLDATSAFVSLEKLPITFGFGKVAGYATQTKRVRKATRGISSFECAESVVWMQTYLEYRVRVTN